MNILYLFRFAQWLPINKGLGNGMTMLGIGTGPFIFNFVQTAYVNPSPSHDGYVL